MGNLGARGRSKDRVVKEALRRRLMIQVLVLSFQAQNCSKITQRDLVELQPSYEILSDSLLNRSLRLVRSALMEK